jgi:hypothetical protein
VLVILLLIVLASSGREPADQVQEYEHEQESKDGTESIPGSETLSAQLFPCGRRIPRYSVSSATIRVIRGNSG